MASSPSCYGICRSRSRRGWPSRRRRDGPGGWSTRCSCPLRKPPDVSAPVDLVLGALEMARGGRFAEICDLFAPPLRPLVTPEGLAAAWNPELARQGPVTSVGVPLTEPTGTGVVVVKVAVSCEHGGFALVAPVTDQGRLAGLQLAPPGAAEPIAPWEPPEYADPRS